MAILFKKIRWKNFLSTGNEFIELDLSNTGSTLIVGKNGAGKSQLLDALTFSLFGKTFRNINKPQLVNSITKKETVVEIEFVVGKISYKVIRGIKPNIFEVYSNGQLMNQSAEVRDYQDILEKQILRFNYKTFCQVVVLGSASFVPFMQLPLGKRREIIEDLLDLQIFTTMNTLLKDKITENTDQIRQNQDDQRLVSEKIKMSKEHLKELQTKNDQFIREKKTTIKDLQTKIQNTKLGLTEYRTNIEEKTQKVKDFGSIQSKVEKLKSLRVQMETKSSTLTKEIEFFTNHENCPTCKQKIDTEFSCEIVNTRQNDIAELEQGLIQLGQKYEETNSQLTELFAIQKELDDLRSKASHEALKIQLLEEQIDIIQKEIADAKQQVKSASDLKIIDLETELATLATNYNELQENKQVLSAASTLLKDGGIKTKIINQYIPIINKLINKYLGEFDLFVEFYLDEQFNEVIKSRHRDEFSYASFSEGEKQKIDLSILFTWRAVAKLRNSMSTNLLILDEVMDASLDGNAADDLLKILQNISSESSIFVISHRENLHDKFENTIKFVKHKNFSKIEE